LACGTPVVGFLAGAPERIALGQYSEFVPYGDIALLADRVGEWLEKDINKEEISRAARGVYSKKTMAEKYIGEYEKLLEGR
ncbi:MAG: glycosyl transferase family 1, partial [Clostridia bacterium]|nr:glycosyl transferase family 1 [Clostridia bacterium]